METKRFFLLDIYRIGIIYLILLFHLNMHFGLDMHFKFLNHFISAGAFAMTGFFMLSGALLSYFYSDKKFNSIENLKDFYKKRFLKLYPLYAVVLILSYILFYFPQTIKWWVIPMQIIPLQSFFPQTFGEFQNGGVWFISSLFFAYFMFPFVNYLIKNIKTNFFIQFFAIYTLIVYFTIVDAYSNTGGIGLYTSPILRTLEFVLGIICAQVAVKYSLNKKCLLYFLISLLMGFILVGGLSHSHYLNRVGFMRNFVNMDLFVCPLTAVTIISALKVNNEKLPKLFKLKIFEYLSNIGYAFFLGQMIVLGFGFKYKTIILSLSDIKILVFATLVNLAIAIILYEIFQKKIQPIIINKIGMR